MKFDWTGVTSSEVFTVSLVKVWGGPKCSLMHTKGENETRGTVLNIVKRKGDWWFGLAFINGSQGQ